MTPTLRRTFAIAALLLTPALSVLREGRAAAAAPDEPPATTPPSGASMGPGSGVFGSVGQVVIADDVGFMPEGPGLAIVHESTSKNGPSSTTIVFQPSLDYFVAPNVSVGGQVEIAHGSSDISLGGIDASGTGTVLGIEVRGGYNFPLTDSFSVWPRLGLGYFHESSSASGTADSTAYQLNLLLSIPVLWHPSSHFFVGAGPGFVTELVSKIEGNSVGKSTDVGLTALLGGYFGGI